MLHESSTRFQVANLLLYKTPYSIPIRQYLSKGMHLIGATDNR